LFEREHHLRISAVLRALDADLLRAQGCLFGGGTAIALSHGEYRESVDVHFLVSSRPGYRELRQRFSARGLPAIVREGQQLAQVGDARIDQYGVRTVVRVANVQIKLEVLHEARIALEAPTAKDRIEGVSTLTPLDMAATKLLANVDRWADDGVFSRDLIDLAMLEIPRPLWRRALAKATEAYGDAVERDLAKAIDRLEGRPGRLHECTTALKMTAPPALLWKKIRRLRPKAR
jgi:hypothetical protein